MWNSHWIKADCALLLAVCMVLPVQAQQPAEARQLYTEQVAVTVSCRDNLTGSCRNNASGRILPATSSTRENTETLLKESKQVNYRDDSDSIPSVWLLFLAYLLVAVFKNAVIDRERR